MSASQPAFTDYTEFEHSDNSGNGSDEETLLFPGAVHCQQHEDRSFVRLLTDIWRPGSDAESSRVNHSFSADEKRKLNVYESIDYFAPNSAVYRRWLARQVRSLATAPAGNRHVRPAACARPSMLSGPHLHVPWHTVSPRWGHASHSVLGSAQEHRG
eukprot:GHRQ01026718.1.p1 GENE.GHRQ01026718.1~~GHRQ01026718.1.p1  ORF type:complete len:157 (+),score=46.94 GHRQ01026718.1:394-864(+)